MDFYTLRQYSLPKLYKSSIVIGHVVLFVNSPVSKITACLSSIFHTQTHFTNEFSIKNSLDPKIKNTNVTNNSSYMIPRD